MLVRVVVVAVVVVVCVEEEEEEEEGSVSTSESVSSDEDDSGKNIAKTNQSKESQPFALLSFHQLSYSNFVCCHPLSTSLAPPEK